MESPPESLNFILGSGNFHGLTFCSLHAVAAAQSDDGRRVHLIQPISRGAYLGTFSQVHLTPRENFKKHVMVFFGVWVGDDDDRHHHHHHHRRHHRISRGAYLGTFSQVHLTPRENFKKHVMVSFMRCCIKCAYAAERILGPVPRSI